MVGQQKDLALALFRAKLDVPAKVEPDIGPGEKYAELGKACFDF